MVRVKFSGPWFLAAEFFILFPSVLFVFGIIIKIVTGNVFLLNILISPNNLLKNIFVEFISPLTGGFVAYNFLEREKPKGFWAIKAKGIIFYSILVVGLIIFSYFF